VISNACALAADSVTLARCLNFVGALISLKWLRRWATGIIDPGRVTETIAFAGLIGATTWNLVTGSTGSPELVACADRGHRALLAGAGAACAGMGVHQGRPPRPDRPLSALVLAA